MSQGEIQRRTGLLRSYLSRVENGHTVPTLETLEKIAAAMDLPLSHFFLEDSSSKSPVCARRMWISSLQCSAAVQI